MKKIIKITLVTLLILMVLAGVLTWMAFGDLVKGARSVQKLDDGFYYMEYEGDDGLDDFLYGGGAKDANELVQKITYFLSKGYYKPPANPDTSKYGCSTITSQTPDHKVLMGRNFDYNDATCVILRTIPKKGYKNISTFNVNFFGFGEGYVPEGFQNQYMALGCLFVALDGINEKGFAIADLVAGDNVETHQNSGKPSFTTTAALAYLLKRAATVDEALELLRGIDMHSDIGIAHHYAISDASGKSVVVEYVDNQMVVMKTNAVANHYLCAQKLNVGLMEGDSRYSRLCSFYDEAGGKMDSLQLTKAICSVSQLPWGSNFIGGTQWTMVMNLTKPSVTYYFKRKFDNPFHFEL